MARELLNVPPLPAFSGFASRLLAETWDSSNLYWARLADETGLSSSSTESIGSASYPSKWSKEFSLPIWRIGPQFFALCAKPVKVFGSETLLR